MEYTLVEFEGQEIKFPVGYKQTKQWLKKFARLVWVPCGVCGAEGFLDPAKETAPRMCRECERKHIQRLRKQGLGGGVIWMLCVDCGKRGKYSARALKPMCLTCKKVAKKLKTTLDPEVRRKRLIAAVNILQRQGGMKLYEGPMDIIASKFVEPGWWDSAPEMVMTAEFLRLGYKVVPQKCAPNHKFDLYLPLLNLLVEVDGKPFHSTPKARWRDIEHDAIAMLRGYKVARVDSELVSKDVKAAANFALTAAKGASDYPIAREVKIWNGQVHPWVSIAFRYIKEQIYEQRYGEKPRNSRGVPRYHRKVSL